MGEDREEILPVGIELPFSQEGLSQLFLPKTKLNQQTLIYAFKMEYLFWPITERITDTDSLITLEHLGK